MRTVVPNAKSFRLLEVMGRVVDILLGDPPISSEARVVAERANLLPVGPGDCYGTRAPDTDEGAAPRDDIELRRPAFQSTSTISPPLISKLAVQGQNATHLCARSFPP